MKNTVPRSTEDITNRGLKAAILVMTFLFGGAARGADDAYKLGLEAYGKGNYAAAASTTCASNCWRLSLEMVWGAPATA